VNEKRDGLTLKRRPDGRYVVSSRLGGTKRRFFYGKTALEALKKLHKAEQAGAQPARRERLAPFLQRWLRDVKAANVRPTTLLRYRRDVERHLAGTLGDVYLSDLTPRQVQEALNTLSARGLGAVGVEHVRKVLRNALSHAEHEGLVLRNAAKPVSLPRKTKRRIKALTPDEVGRILGAFAGHDYEHLVLLAIATGLRPGELLALTKDDIDEARRELRVWHQLQRVDGVYVLTELKAERQRRTLPLPDRALAAIAEQRRLKERWRAAAGERWVERDALFTTRRGEYLNETTLVHRFQRQLEAAGLPRMRFYDLRHGNASLLLAQGVPMRVVQEQLGHSQIALTMDLYTHVAPALLRDAADKIEGVFTESGSQPGSQGGRRPEQTS
jgi:integrase